MQVEFLSGECVRKSKAGKMSCGSRWEFPKNKVPGTISGIPTIRIIVFWDPYWDPPIYGNYHLALRRRTARHERR